jgi:hypothetical protein
MGRSCPSLSDVRLLPCCGARQCAPPAGGGICTGERGRERVRVRGAQREEAREEGRAREGEKERLLAG